MLFTGVYYESILTVCLMWSAGVWLRFRSAESCELQASTSRRNARRKEAWTTTLRSPSRRNPHRASTIHPWSSTTRWNPTSSVCVSSISTESSGSELCPSSVTSRRRSLRSSPVCSFVSAVRRKTTIVRKTDRKSKRKRNRIFPLPSCRPAACPSSRRREANWCCLHHRSEISSE